MKSNFLKLTLLLVFAVMLFAIPNDADAATYDKYTYTISGNEVKITGCDTSASGAIVIPSEIAGKKVTSIGSYAFEDCTSLTSITIPDSVTSIGGSAFYNCTSLTSITIPESVTSIGHGAFEGCTSLTSITIPDSVTSIWGSAFSGCTSLTSITIPDSVTSIGDSAFYNCTSLTSITIPESVTSIWYEAFSGCTSLTSITIPESVTSIGDEAFSGCTSLTSITIPESVTSIESYAFYGCTSLTSITIPESVTSIGSSAFYGCTSLTSITIPESVTSIESGAFYNTAFYNDSSNWTDRVLYIGNHLIKAKTSISGEYIIKSGTICIGGSAFYGCTSLTSITIPESVTRIGGSAFDGCTSLTSITIPESVTSIGYWAFWGCTSLTSITIPESVTSIESHAFRGCTSLTSITIPESVTSIGDMAFYGCSYLKSVLYGGSEEEWNELKKSIGLDNDRVLNADITYNCLYIYITDMNTGKKELIIILSGQKIDYSKIPQKEGYITVLYEESNPETVIERGRIFYENSDLLVDYVEACTYTFLNSDGSVITEKTIGKGEKIVVPEENPVKASTAKYSYTFAGWEGYTEGMTITEDITFTPIFTETINKYTYRFENEDGTLITSGTEDYGFSIALPSETPQKPSTAKYTYTFAGWDGYSEGMTLTGNVTFKAKFTSAVNQYTYIFLNSDGNEFYSKTADYGTKIIPPGDSPFKAEQYLFTGWSGYVSGMILTEDVTFEPQYTLKSYYITVEGLSTPVSVVYGNNYQITPAKKIPYTFGGYYTEPGGKGARLTDSDGNSVEEFGFLGDIDAYPYFEDMDKNIITIESDVEDAEPGDTDIVFDVKLATSKEVQNAILYVKYPSSLSLSDITSPTFAYVEKQSEKIVGDHTVAEIFCIYSFNEDIIPVYEYTDVLSLNFDVSTTAIPGNVTVEITSDSILVGESDYAFDVIKSQVLKINPKLAESISISGSTNISATTKYTATIYPDYTTDKSVEWSVDDETVAKITQEGYLIPVKTGTVKITAKSVSNPSVYATKTVYVAKKADISSVTTDRGYWIESFDSADYDYEIIVDSDATEISFTSVFTGGLLKVNGSVVLSGRAKTVSLTGDTTTITFERTNVTDCTNSEYVIKVTKSDDALLVKRLSSHKINVIFNKSKILAFEKADLLVVQYGEKGKLIDISSVEVMKNDKDAEFEIAILNDCAECKLMLWDGFSMTKPLCIGKTVNIEE